MYKQSQLLNVLDLADQLLRVAQIPLYGSKHSQKTFSQHYLFKLSILRSYMKMTYRDFEDYLKTSTIPEYLGTTRVPQFSTLQKFAKRQNVQHLEKMLLESARLAPKKTKNCGVDATGFKMHHASQHYEKRVGRKIKKKDFFKANIVFDLDNLTIVAVKFRKKPRHDTKDMPALLNKLKGFAFDFFYGDKGYDAEFVHRLLFESGKISLIHLKKEDLPVYRTSGRWRKHMKRHQSNKDKGLRSLCETGNSTIKRRFRDVLTAHSLTMKKIEMLFKMLTYNLDRIAKLEKNIFCDLLEWSHFWASAQNAPTEFISLSYFLAEN